MIIHIIDVSHETLSIHLYYHLRLTHINDAYLLVVSTLKLTASEYPRNAFVACNVTYTALFRFTV